MRRRAVLWSLLALRLLVGCGDSSPSKEDSPVCGAKTASPPYEGASHLTPCSPVSYTSNPPSSGDHYSQWAAFGVYQSPLPRGFWVHNLEHGAVVLSYNCPDGCADDRASAEKFLADLPADPGCPNGQRVILTPDPLLDTRWAASAWGHTLRATCFDAPTFLAFYVAHYGQAPEDECAPGEELRNADGTLSLPADCGVSK